MDEEYITLSEVEARMKELEEFELTDIDEYWELMGLQDRLLAELPPMYDIGSF